MENAVEALKMAFAVMVFVMALSVSMFAFNNVKDVADIVLYTQDETNYYEYQEAKGKAAENRIVGLETIIPTLYKYYNENYTVVFRKGNYNEANGTFSNIEPLTLYTTPSRYRSGRNETLGSYLWGKKVEGKEYSTYDLLMYKKYNKYEYDTNGNIIAENSIFDNVYKSITDKRGNKDIFSFDLEEETLRHEPWTGNSDETRKNLDCFLNGGIYYNPNNNERYIEYTTGFIKEYNNAKFVETIGEYTYSSSQADNYSTEDEEGSTINSLVKEKKKRIIIFTLIGTN